MDLTGQQFAGRYQVLRLLGRGGMGEVYRAHDEVEDRDVALKVLASDAVTPLSKERFEREMRIGASIEHENAIRIYDFGTADDGQRYLAMELLEGESLRQRLRRYPNLNAAQLVDIGIQVCRALVAVHAAGVVHRDLKPDNVFLVTTRDGSMHAKLLDFGISKPFDERGDKRLTRSGTFVGTPKYASPEQVRAEKVDHRSDIYSLGVVLYRCATGRAPRQILEVLAGARQAVPLPNELVPGCVPPALEDAILQMIEPDRELRVQSAEEALRLLERALPETRANGPATADRGGRGVPIWLAPLGIAVVVALGLLVYAFC